MNKVIRQMMLASLLLLMGCNSSLQRYDVAALADDRALTIIRMKVAFAGGDGGCKASFGADGIGEVRVLNPYSYAGIDNEWHYKVIESPIGTVWLDTLRCSQNHYIYNVEREYLLQDYYFEARGGMITYAGDVEISWRPENFKVADLFKTVYAEDDGKFSLQVTNRVRDAAYFLAHRGILARTDRDIVPSLLREQKMFRRR